MFAFFFSSFNRFGSGVVHKAHSLPVKRPLGFVRHAIFLPRRGEMNA